MLACRFLPTGSHRWQLLIVLMIVTLCSCGRERPMTREQIYQARLSVDTLFITEDGAELIAPGNKLGVVVAPKSNELAWAAWTCENPNCPGEGKKGRPFLFIWPNFLAYVKDDGTVGFRLPQGEDDLTKFQEFAEPACPACLKIRDRASESPEERLRFQNWCVKYVLPEAKERIKELDELQRRYEQAEDERRRQMREAQGG